MGNLVETEAFVTVVRAGSFTAAGDSLGISSSYVSKLVTRLENRLGARLLHRTTRKLALTEAGQTLYSECDEAFGRIEQATKHIEASSGSPRGELRVSIPTNLGLVWLSRALSNFVRRHDHLTMDLVYLDRQVDLLDEGFDLAVRIGELPDSSLIARRLLQIHRILVASPSYLSERGVPESPQQLQEHDCLVYSYSRVPHVWNLVNDQTDEETEVSVKGRLVANSGIALAEAATCGVGITFLPESHIATHLRDGRLVRVLPGWSNLVPLNAVFPSGRHIPSKVRVLVEYLAEELREAPWSAK
ncbi:MAG: LysR family transcriptional regulator [Myxococcota bacterium]